MPLGGCSVNKAEVFFPCACPHEHSLREDGSGSAYDKESLAIIKLNNTTVLYLKEVTKFLALVCILREESFERKGNVLKPYMKSLL